MPRPKTLRERYEAETGKKSRTTSSAPAFNTAAYVNWLENQLLVERGLLVYPKRARTPSKKAK